jgi:CspA family cold shock protein
MAIDGAVRAVAAGAHGPHVALSWFSRIFRFVFRRNLILERPRCASFDAVVSDPPKSRLWRRSVSDASSLTGRLRRPTMQQGTVKWFNPTKGYGFIKPTSGDKDVFVHISAVERAGLSTLNEGQTVEYELVTNRGKSSAENLKVA